jgi:hypothetical protein
MNTEQKDLLSAVMEAGPIRHVLHVKGITPSFKTQKTAYGWIDKKSGKIFARPATLPEHKEWMRKTVLDFASQLLTASQIDESTTSMDARRRSLIASLPHDDTWTAIPEQISRGRLCEPGEEPGAEILIELIA